MFLFLGGFSEMVAKSFSAKRLFGRQIWRPTPNLASKPIGH
jgi:hypothetical protein